MISEDIFKELKIRFDKDQYLCSKNLEKEFLRNCRNNLEWLKKSIPNLKSHYENKISREEELYIWTIIQHSKDIPYQKEYLKMLEGLPKMNERNKDIAYLTDKILVNEGKSQIYGTQFSNGKICLTVDLENLETRRKNMGL